MCFRQAVLCAKLNFFARRAACPYYLVVYEVAQPIMSPATGPRKQAQPCPLAQPRLPVFCAAASGVLPAPPSKKRCGFAAASIWAGGFPRFPGQIAAFPRPWQAHQQQLWACYTVQVAVEAIACA